MNKLTWPTVGLIAVLAAAAIALATLAHWDPGAILGVLGILGGIGGGAAVAGTSSARLDDVHDQTTAQTATLDTIYHKVNGELDSRIAAAMESSAQAGAGKAVRAIIDEVAKGTIVFRGDRE